MTILIVTLPLEPATDATEYGYALTQDGRTLAQHASAPAALLPPLARSGGEVVAVVPARALSWHRVELPRGISSSSPRLRAVLDGLLEDRLLDEPETLHFAVAPRARSGAPVWVAVCNKPWLRAAVQVLEAAERPVSRIVPEFAPGASEAETQTVHVTGTPEDAQMIVIGHGPEGGVAVLPLTAASVALALGKTEAPDAPAQVLAEPAVAVLAERLFNRRVNVQQGAQRLLQAAQTPWDLAQFDLASSSRSRAMKRLATFWRELWQAPQWRAARWGAAVLLGLNLIGLNAWAWREQAALDGQRAAIRSALTQTFPDVRVVVDAPVQMAREVATLRQATGAASGRDLEAILGALSTAVPTGRTLSAIDFVAGEVRVQGLGLSPEEVATLATRLPQDYNTRAEGERLIIKPEMGR